MATAALPLSFSVARHHSSKLDHFLLSFIRSRKQGGIDGASSIVLATVVRSFMIN
jgi:hypothetical protein